MTPLAPLALARSGAILVPLSAPDACLRLQRCAPSPPSGGLQELWVHVAQMGNSPQTSTRGAARHLNEKSGLEGSRRRRPRHATDAVSHSLSGDIWLSEKQELFSSNIGQGCF